MTHHIADIELQIAVESNEIPSQDQFITWASAALLDGEKQEITIRVIDATESEELNTTYRGKEKPTNVLSFPFEPPAEIPNSYLGDLAICAPVVEQEASAQNKPSVAHWAHMTVHGVLHLQGLDHQNSAEAAEMESLERSILGSLGFPNPYD